MRVQTVGIQVCTACGSSHKPENRRRLIKRMVHHGVDARTIKEAWPCFYPHEIECDAADRALFRDIADVKEMHAP